jgi:CubicO group peptidase (beta-lactamase class C family)
MALPNVAGSLLTTADDYARFLAALFGPRAATLLDGALHREMLRPHAALGGRLHWGLGWALQREATGASPELLAWHWGDNGTYKNFVMADPRHGRAVVAFTNGSSGFKVYERAIRAVTGRDQAALLFWMVG